MSFPVGVRPGSNSLRLDSLPSFFTDGFLSTRLLARVKHVFAVAAFELLAHSNGLIASESLAHVYQASLAITVALFELLAFCR